MCKVSINNVSKTYQGNVEGVRDVSFTCEDGEFLAILGPSGSGKSSMLRMIAGLEDITKGEILFDERVVNNLTPAQRNIALAFESYALYPLLSVYENIAFPLRARGMSRADVDQKVRFVAEQLGISDILNRKPSSLSGGHQQRVSLARALVRDPNVTLLDEPISHMDQRVRAEMRARIRRLHNEFRLTTIFVTHDQEEAVSLCDRVAVMSMGTLQQIGTVDEVWNRPTNKFVASFVGEPEMNFFRGTIETPREISVATKEGKTVFPIAFGVLQKYLGTEITVGVRPHDITLAVNKTEQAALAASVDLIEFQGESVVVTVKLETRDITEARVVVPAEKLGQIEQRVWVGFRPEVIHLFDGEKTIINSESGNGRIGGTRQVREARG